MASKFSECTCIYHCDHMYFLCRRMAEQNSKMLAKLSISYCTVSYFPFSPRMMILFPLFPSYDDTFAAISIEHAHDKIYG